MTAIAVNACKEKQLSNMRSKGDGGMEHFNVPKTIILDEPLKDADKRKLIFLGDMIKELTNSLGVQFIMVTHEEQLIAAADRAFRVSQENDISSVEVIK